MPIDANSPFYYAPLVGKRSRDSKAFAFVKPSGKSKRLKRDPLEAEMPENAALIQAGFPGDYWITPSVSQQWNSDLFPSDRTLESFHAWENEISKLSAVAKMAERSEFDAIANEYIANWKHDLSLLVEAGLVPADANRAAKRPMSKAPPGGDDEALRLSPVMKKILSVCRKKYYKGTTLANKVNLSYDYARKIFGKLVNAGKLRNDPDKGYRTV